MRTRLQHRQRAETAQLLQQFAHDLYNAFSRRLMVELCSGSGHNSPGFATSRAGYHAAASIAINNWLKLRKSQPRSACQAFFCFAAGAQPLGISVVERSTPERSAPLKSVSRRMATPRSAPMNLAPFTLAPRRLTLRNCAP